MPKARTPPPVIFMVNEGVKGLSRNPNQGHDCFP